MMDRPRAGRRRRTGRILLAVVPIATVALLWQPIKAGLVPGLVHGAELAASVTGLRATTVAAEPTSQSRSPTPAPAAVGPGGERTWSPTFDAYGTLLVPDDYREWVFVGAAVGLSYSERGPEPRRHGAPGNFTHVYLDPDSLEAFRETGVFREGTTFLLDIHRPASRVSIARGGWFEGERTGTHAAVKDSVRFPGGWGYFSVRDGRGTPVATDACRSCHVEHGAIDSVFVQFYPLLRELSAADASSHR